MSISRNSLGLAAEFAVASELCRRNLYAQLTLGNQKRTDLLLMSQDEQFHRVEVKAKQGPTWPNCRGIYGDKVFLVFVDYAKRSPSERPDFYILSSTDWRAIVEQKVAAIRARNPHKRITIDEQNVAVFEDEINKQGQPYRGMGINPGDVAAFHEAWSKISDALGGAS